RFTVDAEIIMPVSIEGEGFPDRPPIGFVDLGRVSFRTLPGGIDYDFLQMGFARIVEGGRIGFSVSFVGEPAYPAPPGADIAIFAFYFRVIGNDVEDLGNIGAFRLGDGRVAGWLMDNPFSIGLGLNGFEITTPPGTMSFAWASTPLVAHLRRQIPDENIFVNLGLAADFDGIIFSVATQRAWAGREVALDIIISNNPGFASATMRIDFPPSLILTGFSARNTDEMDIDEILCGFLGPEINPCGISGFAYIGWLFRAEDIQGDGAIIRLIFYIDQNAQWDLHPVNISFANRGGYPDPPKNLAGERIDFRIINGGVIVIEQEFFGGRIGDINNDGAITSRDTTILAIFLHENGGAINIMTCWIPEFSAIMHPRAADINEDGYICFADVILLARWLVGHNVTIPH
ncbi:MAG: hypothetical protein FWB71_05470, partial [Defluviitaleaceae bacterium]|nr:hypothetical protein [Defluviitaleaceae bacterium]